MNYFKYKIVALMTVVGLVFGATSCKDEGYEDVSGTASQTLWEVISSRSDLKSFSKVLKQYGYDELLASSGTFTVLAPSDASMSGLADSLLSEVPSAHIANFGYNKTELSNMNYLSMIDGRMVLLSDMNLTDTEIVCRNGFLRFAQESGNARSKQSNIYELLISIANDSLSDYNDMARFIVSLGDSVMDSDKSVQVGVDPDSNLPIYDTVMTYYNPLFEYVPLNDNDSLVSLVLVDDSTWLALQNRYWRYMRQHVDASGDDGLRDPSKDMDYGYGAKFDTVATDYVTRFQLVRDLTCSYEGATRSASVNNPGTVNEVYRSRTGIEITMDYAVVADTLKAANGRIERASGVKIKLANNRIKDVYVEGEDYYFTNENYVATLVDPTFSGSRYVKTYGIDSLRGYTRYVLDSLGNRAKCLDGTDSTEYVPAQLRYVYNTSQYSGALYGGSVLGYKVNLFSCNYRVQWRHVVPGGQGSNYCNPDTLDVNYANYVENANWPIGGVMRHIQKMYLSQPGDNPLEYSSDYSTSDFVKNPYPSTSYSVDRVWYRCMTDYDTTAVISSSAKTDQVSSAGPIKWYRMGVNAGYGLDDPTFETRLVWCETAKDHASGVININPDTGEASSDAVYTSGITKVSADVKWNPTANNDAMYGVKAARRVPRDIFMCLYNGEATVFVTSNPFGTDNASGKATLAGLKGSIFLDYIHFIPVIDEDD